MENYFREYVIEQASIMFYSNHYTQLKCKIVDKITDHVICSCFISNCIERYMPICRKITDFFIQLWDCSSHIAKFQFTEEDIDGNNQHIMYSKPDQINQKIKYACDHVRLKKETDQCCLYFKVYEQDLQKQQSPYLFVSDFHHKIVEEFYQKMTKKALKKIQKFNQIKRSDRRFSNGKFERKNSHNMTHQFNNSLGMKQTRGMFRVKTSFIEGLDKKMNFNKKKLQKTKTVLTFHQKFEILKKTERRKKMKTLGLEQLISEKIYIPFEKQEDYEKNIIAQSPFLIKNSHQNKKNFRSTKKKQKENEKQKQFALKQHKKYASVI